MERVGYWMSDKKLKRHRFVEFAETCRLAGFELVKLDLDRPLESQGPFSIILHKVTDLLAKCEQGNGQASEQIKRLKDYCTRHPDTVVIDPIENIYPLLHRRVQYDAILQCTKRTPNCMFKIPAFVQFLTNDVEENKRLLKQHNVQYPIVCKPSIANGTSFCHKMQLIFNEEGLRDVEPPCVAQTFINHNAILYKVFVIGEHYFLVQRPSLKNFSPGPQQTIFFDSHDVSKADSASYLNEVGALEHPPIAFDWARLEHLATHLSAHLGLALYGADVIVQNVTGQYYVIDINNFPSYDGVPNSNDYILKHLKTVLASKASQAKPSNQSEAMDNCTNQSQAVNNGINDNNLECNEVKETNGTVPQAFHLPNGVQCFHSKLTSHGVTSHPVLITNGNTQSVNQTLLELGQIEALNKTVKPISLNIPVIAPNTLCNCSLNNKIVDSCNEQDQINKCGSKEGCILETVTTKPNSKILPEVVVTNGGVKA